MDASLVFFGFLLSFLRSFLDASLGIFAYVKRSLLDVWALRCGLLLRKSCGDASSICSLLKTKEDIETNALLRLEKSHSI